MKILENGIIVGPEDEKMEVTCKYCKAKLEITPKDVKSDLAIFGHKHHVVCKNCKEKVKVKNMTPNFRLHVKIWNFED